MASLAQITDHDYSREKIDLIKRTIAKDCSDDELQLFLYTCKRTGLDPLARQIYAIKRNGRMTIQTGIDGYRVIADRTGKLAGISDYQFDSEDKEKPGKATVTVRKAVDGGTIAEFTATARWGEYCAGGPMWQKMPYLMLGKCAEALALRKAFPADLSGVYTTEEMAQADNGQQEATVRAEVERQQHASDSPATPPELDWMYQKTTGVLICRVLSAVSRKKKKGEGQYLTVKINDKINGTDVLMYFHESFREELLAAKGKIAKFMVEPQGDFIHIAAVTEIDGKHLTAPVTDNAETKARLLASTLNFTEDELMEGHRLAHGDWSETLAGLERYKAQTEGISTDDGPEAA